MYIHQISVFIENKPGNIANFTNFLAEHKIDMRAFQIADSSDFGIIRIIVDDPFNTLTLLETTIGFVTLHTLLALSFRMSRLNG